MKISLSRLIVSLVIISTVISLTSRSSQALVPLNPNLQINKNLLKIDPWAIRCANIKTKAESKIDKFEKNRTNHYETYIKLAERLESKINDWENTWGYDVKKLKEDLSVLEDKINEYNDDYTVYMDKLDKIKVIDCDNSETDLSNALKDARNSLKEVRKDVVEIKTYYWSVIRQDIMELKKQIISGKED